MQFFRCGTPIGFAAVVLGNSEPIDLIAKMEELELILETHSRRSA